LAEEFDRLSLFAGRQAEYFGIFETGLSKDVRLGGKHFGITEHTDAAASRA